MRTWRNSIWRRLGLLFPALTWIAVQVAMAGGLHAAPASGLTIELCSTFGTETLVIDLETGEPVEPARATCGCDWCHSFGKAVDLPPRAAPDWQEMAVDFAHRLTLAPPPHLVLRLVGDAQSRAPPVL
ncbi:MAG: hypothetical protein RIG84_13285 [Roseovarius sp.]